MSKSSAESNQQLQDDVQEAVKSILGATKPLSPADYSKVLTSTLAATQKSVKIQIASADLTRLKQSGYKLCFAKKLDNEDYDVVWQSYTNYLSNNTFSWTPQYQLFGASVFQANLTVDISTNLVQIGLGQQSILDNSGLLGPAATGGPANSINLANNYGPIYPGICQLSTGIDGRQVSTPIYVAPAQVVQGLTALTPTDTLLVWFEQNVQTGTMFNSSRSQSIEIDMNVENNAVRLYTGGSWTTP